MKLSLFDLFMFWNIALMLIGTFLGAVGLRRPTRQYPTPHGKLGFRKPITGRIAMVMLGFVFASGPEMIIGQCHTAISVGLWIGLGLFGAICLAFGAICLRASGPEDLILDMQTRTYLLVTGWPLFPRSYSGGWEDMYELCAWEGGGSTTYYFVCIAWVSERPVTPLGRFSRRLPADQFADEMSKLLCLKRVNSRPY